MKSKTFRSILALISILCMISFSVAICESTWDSSIRFIDVSNNESVKDAETVSTALSCIELAKSSSDNPFSFKIQDVQYAKSAAVKDNDYFLIAYTLGDNNPKSCFIAYDRPTQKTFIYGFNELIFNHEVLTQLNGFYIIVMQFNFEGKYTGTMLNQGEWSAKEIASRMDDFYQIWDTD